MVNRIDKLPNRPGYEVKEVDEDGGHKQEQPDDEAAEKDGFQKKAMKAAPRSRHVVQGEKLRLAKADLARAEFRALDLATDPSILTVLLVRVDGTREPNAVISLPRRNAFTLRGLIKGAAINLKNLTPDAWLDFVIPFKPEDNPATPAFEQETTVSHIFHPETRLQRLADALGMREVATGNVRLEIIGIYAIVFVIFFFFIFGWIYLG